MSNVSFHILEVIQPDPFDDNDCGDLATLAKSNDMELARAFCDIRQNGVIADDIVYMETLGEYFTKDDYAIVEEEIGNLYDVTSRVLYRRDGFDRIELHRLIIKTSVQNAKQPTEEQ